MHLSCALAALVPLLWGCVTTPTPVPGTPLDGLLEEVQKGLQSAQNTLAGSGLPQLQSVRLTLQTQAKKGNVPLVAQSLTLDLVFTVTKDAHGGIEFSFGYVSVDVAGGVENLSRQRITITFA